MCVYIVYANKQLQWLITKSYTRFYRLFFLFLFFTFVIIPCCYRFVYFGARLHKRV